MSHDYPQQYEFQFGDVFKSDDPRAQFIVSLAAATNDALFLHDLWLGDNDFTQEQSVWFMRQAMSQLWEVREFMNEAEENACVTDWLDGLPGDIATHLVNLRKVLDSLVEGDDGKERLAKARNHTWHYPAPGSAMRKAMASLADTTQRVTMTGPTLKDMRASFADEVLFKITFDKMSKHEFRDFVQAGLQPGVQAVMNFGVRAYGYYVKTHPDAAGSS